MPVIFGLFVGRAPYTFQPNAFKQGFEPGTILNIFKLALFASFFWSLSKTVELIFRIFRRKIFLKIQFYFI